MATAQLHGLLRQLRRVAFVKETAPLTDGDLLGCFLARQDADAFEALVCRHGPTVLGICRQVLSDVQEAEDASQATFLVLLHKARLLR